MKSRVRGELTAAGKMLEADLLPRLATTLGGAAKALGISDATLGKLLYQSDPNVSPKTLAALRAGEVNHSIVALYSGRGRKPPEGW